MSGDRLAVSGARVRLRRGEESCFAGSVAARIYPFCRRHIFALLTANCLLLTPVYAGCGLTWSMPTNHYDGVDRFGYASLWYKIGELRVDDKFTLPLHMNFNSSRQTSSPYLGAGWSLALLESQIVQQEENRFRLVEPSGWGRIFWRKNAKETVLDGQGGWKAEIRADRISAWAECGTRLDYYRGRIVGMKTGGHDIQFVQNGGHLAEIRSGMRTLVRVERDVNGDVTGLALDGGERIALERGDKPRVEYVAGKNLLAGVEPGVTRVEAAKVNHAFEYRVDSNVRPLLVVDASREIVWNPEDGRMVRDGEWTYETRNPENVGNAEISRTAENGIRESWFLDTLGSKEITVSANGLKLVKNFHAHGPMRGLLRLVTRTGNGVEEKIYEASYDEKGQLIHATYEGLNFSAGSNGMRYSHPNQTTKNH